METADTSEYFTAQEVAQLFGVNPKTVTRWAVRGLIPCVTTLGGHRRYRRADVLPLLENPA